ncbi:MAG: hypothetical protein ABIP34_23390, partial [Rhodoferax sp.]|uniref:hypothetical protein n=1 Tax=Rhodoferax sp. TaxID=50421 RepID=UPI0032657C11
MNIHPESEKDQPVAQNSISSHLEHQRKKLQDELERNSAEVAKIAVEVAEVFPLAESEAKQLKSRFSEICAARQKEMYAQAFVESFWPSVSLKPLDESENGKFNMLPLAWMAIIAAFGVCIYISSGFSF